MCAVFRWLSGGTDSALSSSSSFSLLSDSCESSAPSSLSFSSSELSPISLELVGTAGGGEMLDCEN